jgi:DNA polymerase-3 subunit delta
MSKKESAGISREALLAAIQQRDLSPIYLLHGEEPWFIDELVTAFEDHVLEEHERDFNFTVLYGKDTSIEEIVDASQRFPMMAERQLVIVKEAQELAGWKSEEQRDRLERYANNPQKTTVLVLAHKYKSVASNTKVYKALASAGTVFASDKISEAVLPKWIGDLALSRGCKLAPDVVQLLAEYLGSDLQNVVHAVEKLHFTVGDDTITTAHVEKYIGISKEYNVFELQTAIANKDHLKAQKIANYFAGNPRDNHIIAVVAFLFSFYSKLLIYHRLTDKSPRSLGASLKLPWTAIDTFRAAGANYSELKIVKNIGVLRSIDRKVKGLERHSLSDADLFRQMVFDLMN